MSADIKLSGCGSISGGEYGMIRTSGSSKLFGTVKCRSITVSGSAKGEDVECTGDITFLGSASFSGNIKAENILYSGSFSCTGNVTSLYRLEGSGSLKCEGKLRCAQLICSGFLITEDGIDTEIFSARGAVCVKGTVNAKEIEIKCDGGANIGGIKGEKVRILADFGKKLPLISKLANKITENTAVLNRIDGDEITLEYTDCPSVTGRRVRIGKGCNIGLVRYSEDIEISEDARVNKTEKI